MDRPLTTSERIWVVVAVVLLIVGATAESWAGDERPEIQPDGWYFDFETGSQYDGATCWEADGTAGVTEWPECVTPAEAEYAEWIAAAPTPEYETGATFDGGVCWEADGTEGLSTFDYQCMTPADYDEIFSYENLAATESVRPFDDGRSIADVYELVEDETPASERELGAGLVDVPFTFAETVRSAHAPHMPIAD